MANADSNALATKLDLTHLRHEIELFRRNITAEIRKAAISLICITTGIVAAMLTALGIVIILVLG